jgi:hypothetical protein
LSRAKALFASSREAAEQDGVIGPARLNLSARQANWRQCSSIARSMPAEQAGQKYSVCNENMMQSTPERNMPRA